MLSRSSQKGKAPRPIFLVSTIIHIALRINKVENGSNIMPSMATTNLLTSSSAPLIFHSYAALLLAPKSLPIYGATGSSTSNSMPATSTTVNYFKNAV
jgi:hypothetical protein